MVNVLIINDWVSNLVAGGTYRVQGFAKGFSSLGFKVFITTPWRVIEYRKHVKMHQPNIGSPLYYATTGLMLPLQVVKSLAKSGSIDLVLIQMPSPFTKALSILPILKLFNTPLVFDFGDPWWKKTDPTLYKYISNKLIQLQVRESMLISSSSKLILKFINNRNKVWIPNGIDDELFKVRSIKQYNSSLVGFLGAFTKRSAPELIIPMLSELIRRGVDVRFILIGGGDSLPIIREEAIKKGLNRRILFTGNVPRHRIPELLSMCNVLVAPYKELPELHFIFPTKVPEMMALKKPVITARLYEIVTTFKIGEEVLVAKYDATDYAKKLIMLINNDHLRNKIAENGYVRVSRDLTWKKLVLKILESLKNLGGSAKLT